MLLSLCCVLIHELLYGSQSNDKNKLDVRGEAQCIFSNSTSIWNGELHLDGWVSFWL